MGRKIWMLWCAMVLGLLMTIGWMGVCDRQQGEPASCAEEIQEEYAWWNLMYERPNPDRLPVEVHFQWLKGLE